MTSRHNTAMTYGDEGEPTEPAMTAADEPLRDYGVQDHRGRVVTRWSRWRVFCTCRWESRLQGTPDDAWREWRNHVRDQRENDE